MKEYLKLASTIFFTGTGLYQSLENYSQNKYITRPTRYEKYVHNMGIFFVYSCPITMPVAYYLKYKE